ncbi:DUF3577 domain-containing protein [Brenneria tiliae]|uniref:DUF3577 domain-containing protein n=1 Tax=Brenneria tiliae TaxID=2914984 RepID=UPI0020149021|nr:DUF3577 domain-containing protein [Brenneria tiliae]MCL2897144.1 DUF3577 domain-containing protein [Brenneria tiliae]MCL2904797.1 DUF3577 domain-containing protein [Brenneria tiliae]
MTTENKYFDLHTRGIGYVNRLRTVTPKRGEPFMACTIAALRGTKDSPEYSYIDVRVYNEKAASLLDSCQDALNKKQKVLIAFTVGDIYPEVFTYQSGAKSGQPGCSIKGRLIKITTIKIDGFEVYRENAEESQPAAA